jgi:Endonuclease/Exonuclease/phosphatase family
MSSCGYIGSGSRKPGQVLLGVPRAAHLARLSVVVGAATLAAIALDPLLWADQKSTADPVWPPSLTPAQQHSHQHQHQQHSGAGRATPPPPPRLALGDPLRFLSLNAFIRPLLVGADWKDQRLALLAKVLVHRQYALACTQEIFWAAGWRKHTFLRMLRRAGSMPYAVSAPLPWLPGLLRWPPKFIDGGLSITSRYPIVAHGFLQYKHVVLHSVDCIVAKGVLYALVQVPLAPLSALDVDVAVPPAPAEVVADGAARPDEYAFIHVFTTHMQASNGLDIGPFKRVRAAQVEEMAQYVRKTVMQSPYPNHTVVIAGDFNVDGRAGPDNATSSASYRFMMHTLSTVGHFRDVIYDANNSSHPVTSAGGLDGQTQKNERLDYILWLASQHAPIALKDPPPPGVNQFRQESESPKPPFRTLSDHYGVEATFGLQNRSRDSLRMYAASAAAALA